jgi:Cell division protein CrgA
MSTKAKAGPGRVNKAGRSTRGRATGRHQSNEPAGNDRYTPPIPKNAKVSPPWMGAVIVGLFVLGVLIIILNYSGLLPGGVSNWWLLGAIGSIFAGLMVATRYH